MKRGLLRRIADDYEPLIPSVAGWKRIGNEFTRRSDEWVQILGFNASRFDDRYVPRCAFQFLWIDGVPNGAFLVQELQTAKGVQRWVTMTEHDAKRDAIFADMKGQFKPRIDAPLDRAYSADCDRWFRDRDQRFRSS